VTVQQDRAALIFRKSKAVLEGHFLLASGLHSPVYWEKFQVLQYPEYTVELCGMIADHFRSQNISLVAGPTTGGVLLAFEVARQLGVRGIFAERKGENERAFRRGFTISPGERVLIVDDILTTGSSVYQMIKAVNEAQGDIKGIGVLVDRSETEPQFGYPLFSCLRSITPAYTAENCPLCALKVPLVKPGHGQS